MADHLTSEMTDGYRARSLTTDELLAVTAHLADCEECRQSTASHHGTGKLLEALGDPHLSYESLEAIVHGGREGLDHVSDCAMCAEELKDLRAFYAGMRQSRPGTEPRGWRIGVLVPVGSLALAAIILTGILLRPGNKAADVSASQPYVGQPRALATLRDSGRVLALNETGAVIGMDELAPAERDQIAEVLRSGRILVAPPERDLLRSRETLLGVPAATAEFRPVTPTGRVVLSDQPAFEWQAPGNAGAFRVSIYDSDFELVESSGTVQGRVWISRKPLPRGKIFNWTVSAIMDGTRVTAPRPPEPEARFRVASAEEARQMDAARKAAPASDLQIALAAARLGFRDEAREALRRLQAQNPGSPLAQQLLENFPAK